MAPKKDIVSLSEVYESLSNMSDADKKQFILDQRTGILLASMSKKPDRQQLISDLQTLPKQKKRAWCRIGSTINQPSSQPLSKKTKKMTKQAANAG